MTSAQRELAYLGTILTFVVGGLLYWRHHERADAIVQFQLHAQDSTAKVQLDSVASTSRAALEAASQAQAQKAQALRLVAAGEALRAKQDSLVKVSANERQKAEQVAKDSAATAQALRLSLEAVIAASRRDSAVAASERKASGNTIAQLLRSINGSDTTDAYGKTVHVAGYVDALTAEQRRSHSLHALTETLTREVGLLKKAQPSTFGNVVRVVGWAGAGFALGHLLK